MCNNTSAQTCNIMDNVDVTKASLYWNNVHFEGDEFPFKGHMINRILHLWSFHNEIYETHQRLVS